jgi:hypothetical protein
LDSICPTGFGKVAGVKLEIDEEKWAGGAEVMGRFELWSAGMNGISREKAQMAHPPSLKLPRDKKGRSCFVAPERDYTVIRGFSRCRLMGKRRGLGKDWGYAKARLCSFFPKKTLVKNFTMMQLRPLFCRDCDCGTGGSGVLKRAF